jgi:hypothetical protein
MTRTARTGPESLEAQLHQLGFRRSRVGVGYRRDGLVFKTEGRWSTLQAAAAEADVAPLHGQLGRPGLWKPLPGGGRPLSVFDLPHAALTAAADADEDEEAAAPFEACLAWALATAEGRVPDGWAPPPRSEVESWLPPGGLTLQVGPFVRQGTLAHGPDRLALTFPVLPRIPDDLPESRRAWLAALLLDAQTWRLVRVGLTDAPGHRAAYAEVDLTGAPAAALECLMRTGLGALRWVVQWLVGPAAFLADGARACRALEEVCPWAGQPAERKVMA